MSLSNKVQAMGKNINKLRKTNNLSQKEMAKELKIGVKTLSKIERGILPPRLSASVLIDIYFHFGVRPSELFDESLASL